MQANGTSAQVLLAPVLSTTPPPFPTALGDTALWLLRVQETGGAAGAASSRLI